MSNYPAYTPMTSLGRELGIMFAFIGACLVTMAVYAFAWRAHQRKTTTADLARRKTFAARVAPETAGLMQDRSSGATGLNLGTGPSVTVMGGGGTVDGPVHEKMLDRYAMPVNRVELPVHADEIGERVRSRSRLELSDGVGVGNGNGRGRGSLGEGGSGLL